MIERRKQLIFVGLTNPTLLDALIQPCHGDQGIAGSTSVKVEQGHDAVVGNSAGTRRQNFTCTTVVVVVTVVRFSI